jgi:hypothetical protein
MTTKRQKQDQTADSSAALRNDKQRAGNGSGKGDDNGKGNGNGNPSFTMRL